mmetsp:Transcript_13831/g.47856  ORF Transcript_13831/g.47856 Transcript_13831/m.47856 type:complete len:205 (-) Transcript_13831:205-819(-)
MQQISHLAEMFGVFQKVVLADLACRSQRHEVHGVFCAGPSSSLVPCTMHEVGKFGSMTDVQRSDPSRSIELVTSDGQEVDSEVIHVNRDLANRLRGIGVYQDAFAPCDLGNAPDVVDGSCLIVRQHDRNKGRVFPYGSSHLLGVNLSVLVDPHVRDLHAVNLLEILAALQHGDMLGCARHDVSLGLPQPLGCSFERPVDRLRSP